VFEKIKYIYIHSIKAGFVKEERDWVNNNYLAYETEKYKQSNVPIDILD